MTLYSVTSTDGKTMWFSSKKAAKRHKIDHNRKDKAASKEYKKENKGNPDAIGYESVVCYDPKAHHIDRGKPNMIKFLNEITGG